MGVMPGLDFPERDVPFGSGDGIFLYTDGITDARDDAKDAFGEDRLLAVLGEAIAQKQPVGAALWQKLEAFASNGKAVHDDVTLVALVRQPKGS
jgi:sigma-B regulation protein RsbU (phosphoserine phosphatase)